MRHPDRRQSEHVGEAIVGQRAAEVRQDRRAARRWSPRSTPPPSAPTGDRDRGASPPSAPRRPRRTSTFAKPRASRCVRIAGMNVRQSQPATKRICRCAVARGGIALTGRSGLPVRNASTSSAFQPNTRSAGVKPGSPQFGVDRRAVRLAGLDVRERAPHRFAESARGTQRRRRGSGRARRPSTRSRWRARCRDWRGARPSCPNGARRRAASTTRSKLNAPREPRKIVGRSERRRGPSEAISTSARKRLRARLAELAQPGRADLLAHFDQQLRVEAEPPARREHPPERREVDRVLALVVGGAAPVPAAAAADDLPRRAAVAPLAVVARDDVAVAVGQHRRQRRILDALGEEHRRRAGDRVRARPSSESRAARPPGRSRRVR